MTSSPPCFTLEELKSALRNTEHSPFSMLSLLGFNKIAATPTNYLETLVLMINATSMVTGIESDLLAESVYQIALEGHDPNCPQNMKLIVEESKRRFVAKEREQSNGLIRRYRQIWESLKDPSILTEVEELDNKKAKEDLVTKLRMAQGLIYRDLDLEEQIWLDQILSEV